MNAIINKIETEKIMKEASWRLVSRSVIRARESTPKTPTEQRSEIENWKKIRQRTL